MPAEEIAGAEPVMSPGGERSIRPMEDPGVQYLQVQTTTDSRAEAMELAQAAVAARLAASAQVGGPVASVYWWDSGLERAEEWTVLLKLPADRYDELAAFLAERHSYDEPEIIAVPIVAGSAAYLTWMREETRPTAPLGRGTIKTRAARSRSA